MWLLVLRDAASLRATTRPRSDYTPSARGSRSVAPMKLGYFLSSEEWGRRKLVANAVKAEQAGSDGLWLSDREHVSQRFGCSRAAVPPKGSKDPTEDTLLP